MSRENDRVIRVAESSTARLSQQLERSESEGLAEDEQSWESLDFLRC